MKSIATKLLISIGITTTLFFLYLSYQTYSLVSVRVKEVVEQQASIALKFDVAIRDYIAQHVRPVMYALLDKENFMPETMSTSFVARTIFEDVRKEFPNYIIKFSSDNPRNPLNRAGAEEQKIIDYFNNNPQSKKWEGEISINDKQYFAKFSAMRMEKACLRCHGDPGKAPASLVKRYGSTAGFHRQLGKVIGMDTVAIPMVKLTQQLWPELRQAFFLIALGLLLFFLSIIFLTRFIVTKRLSSITKHFLTSAQQSNYQELTPIEIEGNDEIRDLAVSFNSLSDRLKIFYSSLDTQVKDRTRELSDKNEQMKREIEERKRVEEALRASEKFLNTLINAIPLPIFYKDRNGRYLGFNKAFETFSGETREGLIGKTVFDINPSEIAKIHNVRDKELFESGKAQQYEAQVENAHGVLRDVIFNKAVFTDSHEAVNGLIGTIFDITDNKQMVEDLRESELKYKTLIDNINSGVVVYEAANDGEDFIIVDFNKSGEKIENIRKEDLIGKSVLDVFPGVKDFGLFDVFKRVWKTGKPEYFPITFYEDNRISGWRENYVYKLPSKEIIAVYDDKTEHKKSEEALRRSEEKYRELVENLNDVIYLIDSNGTITYVSPPVESVLGYTRSDLVGKNYEDYVHPDDLDAMRQVFKDVLQNRIYPSDFRIRNKGGEYRWVRISSRPIHEENKAKGLQGVLTDIDEYKRADDALRESEENMRYILKHDPNAIAVYDSKLHYIAVSDRYLQDYNVKEKDIIGKHHYEVFPEMPQKWKDVHKRCLAGAVERNDDDYFERPDGSITYNRWECRPWRRIDGEIGGIITYTEVTTERKKAEKELRESEEKFRNLFNNAGAGMFRTRIDGSEMLDMNQKFLDIFGRSREEMQGSPSKIHWADPSEREEMVRRFKFEDQVSNFECRMLNKQGDVRTCLTSLRFYHEQGILEGSIVDITERKQIEKALLESEALFRNLVDSAPEGIFVQAQGRFLFLNPSMVRILGATNAEELIGTDLMARIAPNYHEAVRNRIRFQSETGKPVRPMDQEYLRIDGSTVSVETTAVPIRFQGLDAHLVFVRDITERKQVEKNLLESEKRFSTIFHTNPAAIALSRFDNNQLVNVNQAWQKITGYTQSEALGHTPLELNLWDVPAQRERLTKMLLERDIARDEVQIRRKSGEIIEMLFSAEIIELSGESYLLTMGQDITDRKKAEVALRESEEKYRSMMESFSDPLYICSPDLKIKYMNPEMNKRVGRDAIGEPCYSVLHGNSNKCEWCNFDKVIEGELFETNIKSPLDGRDYRVTSMPIRNQDGTISKMAIYKDITDYLRAISEREETQMQLIQSQKMESIGSLAGGIAHDFNNLLTTIIGNADFALDQAGEHTSLYSEIEEIRKAGRKAAALTRQLLAFSRKQLIRPEILNINDILKDTEKMLRRTIGEDIEFKIMFEPELWNVKVDPGQIEQILLNLVVNARDAMPTEGKLTIETSNVKLDDVYVQNHGVKNGRGSYAMMAVTDTGIGMDEETRSRIFEPFFTTKERDQGTGLGLSTVYGIVKQNNGHIWAYSEPGKGATFKIYFPRLKVDETPEIEEQMDENRLKGSETILVVEDSKTLLKLTQKMLESYGYKVLAARSANEAVEIFNRHDGLIHLLLTDVVMPGISGRKLAEKIISENPKVKVLYMSGYTDDTISKHGVLFDDVELIEKPFSQKNMGLKVRKVLDQGIYD